MTDIEDTNNRRLERERLAYERKLEERAKAKESLVMAEADFKATIMQELPHRPSAVYLKIKRLKKKKNNEVRKTQTTKEKTPTQKMK